MHRRRHRREGGRGGTLGGVHARRPRPTGLDAVEWAKRVVELGAGELLVTSMDTDGHKDGYDIAADARDQRGGRGAGDRQRRLRRRRSTWSMRSSTGKADAVLAASIFHFGEYSIGETKRYMAAHGVPVRL